MQVTVDDIQVLLMRWGRCSRGMECPKQYGSLLNDDVGGADNGNWPADVVLLEQSLVEMRVKYIQGVRMVEAIKAEYLPARSMTKEVKAKKIQIRRADWDFYLGTSLRYLTDVYNDVLIRERKNGINSDMIAIAA